MRSAGNFWRASALAVALGAAAGIAHGNSAQVDASLAGWLDQYLLLGLPDPAPSLAADACAPASAVNALVYLQNRYPEIYDLALAGGNQTDWAPTAALLAGPEYFQTIPGIGTDPVRNLPLGLQAFLSDRGHGGTLVRGILPQGNAGGLVNELVGALPPGFDEGVPSFVDLGAALLAGSPVIVSILYEGQTQGHNVLVTGLSWTGDGPAASGTMTFIDPLDPANYDADGFPVSMKLTSGNVTILPALSLENPETGVMDALTNVLALDYLQYQGRLPYDPGNYMQSVALIGGMTYLQIPEPTPAALATLAGAAWFLLRRRRPPLRKRHAAPESWSAADQADFGGTRRISLQS
jgi:hypothetical protein